MTDRLPPSPRTWEGEEEAPNGPALLGVRIPDVSDRGIVAGITGRGPGEAAGSDSDFGLATGGAAWQVAERYEALAAALGMGSAIVARQEHGDRVLWVEPPAGPGLHIPGPADGFVTRASGVLLVVTVADCVPVYLAAAAGDLVGLLHAGWRGTAAGILERGLDLMRAHGAPPPEVRVHLGPAICGDCYEVGSEVLRAFGRSPDESGHIDLREELSRRAVRAGVPAVGVNRSTACTRCESTRLFSHRRSGSGAGRMAAFLGRRRVADRVASGGES